jgi:DNA-directed RNA polymerase specialized sigma24 family protein
MTAPDSFDADLLLRARKGDGEALGALLEFYRSNLVLLARVSIDRRLQGKADASDLVQETFLQAHDGFAQFHVRARLRHRLKRAIVRRPATRREPHAP